MTHTEIKFGCTVSTLSCLPKITLGHRGQSYWETDILPTRLLIGDLTACLFILLGETASSTCKPDLYWR